MLELVTGNLLEADTEALVNTVNTEGVMGKGIALQFKKKYPDMFEAYHRACKEGLVQPGRMHVYERREMLNPRYISNFPTKTLAVAITYRGYQNWFDGAVRRDQETSYQEYCIASVRMW